MAHRFPKSKEFILPANYDRRQVEKQRLQQRCPHTYWSTRCGICTAILASDHHIIHHTPSQFNMNSRVALYFATEEALTLQLVRELQDIAEQYDELTIIMHNRALLPLYSSLRFARRVIHSTIEEEVAHMKLYRANDVVETSLITHTDQFNIVSMMELCTELGIKHVERKPIGA
jgi:hypothetical protein